MRNIPWTVEEEHWLWKNYPKILTSNEVFNKNIVAEEINKVFGNNRSKAAVDRRWMELWMGYRVLTFD